MNKRNTPTETTFRALLAQIQQTRQKVFAQANTALMELYWHIGQTISEKVQREAWGKSVVTELARYIAQHAPELKGFSDKNLWRMKQFYETYQGDEKLSPLVRALPWSHNLAIFSRCKTAQERQFYLVLAAREQYTFRELDRQISASTFERTVAAPAKLSTASREIHPAIGEAFKDRYVLEFLGLSEPHNESDLKRALVAFELKVGQFKPEHMGQLNFYLEALDRDIKKPHENPSIGVLLCRDKDDEVVEYALSRNLSPALVAQYQLQLPDKKLIQAKLHELLAQEWGDEV